MKRIRIICLFIVLPVMAVVSCQSESVNVNYIGNRVPLHESRFMELPLGSISADGWLLATLQKQADGLTGHLDEYYPEVMGPRNGWLGGDGDQWERGPYWIDGLLPLAYILDDGGLKAKIAPWIEWMLASAKPDGYFGPDKDYPHEKGLQRNNCEDWWPRMVVLKILQQYYNATGDQRVITLMTNYFRYQLSNLQEKPLDNWTFWARFRGGDNLMSVYWLYNITGDKFLLDLGKIIYEQTEPYTEHFLHRDLLTRVGTIHGVNLAQGFKTPIVYWQYDDDDKYLKAVEIALADIRRHQGFPNGMFSVDEQLHGNDPVQGIELCAIVEYMFSLETMYRITGNPKFAELLERIAFNALPAQTDDDYMTRQYYQQTNQISACRGSRNFDCSHGDDTCFGLLTGYPCCTSNMHQGWPKFVQNLWYATPAGGLAATIYSPCTVNAKVADGVDVRIAEKTRYPFETDVTFSIESMSRKADFPLEFRIPEWSRQWSIHVNDEFVDSPKDDGNIVSIIREWAPGDRIRLHLEPEVALSVWKENSKAIERGPLVYALRIESEKTAVGNPPKDGFFEFRPKSDWNYALIQCPAGELENSYQVDTSHIANADAYPWTESEAPVRIYTKAVKALDWKEYNGQAGPLPFSHTYGFRSTQESYMIELIPYGCSILRITEFPEKGKHSADNYSPIDNQF